MENVTRHHWISVAAYYKAQARYFISGKELDDWLAAENDYMKTQISCYLAMAKENGGITTSGLQQLAKSVGVENADSINLKIELIQSIQNATDHNPCFRSGRVCPEKDGCQWRAECKKLIAEWLR